MSSVLRAVLNYQEQNTDFITLEQASIERDMEELGKQNTTLESLYALADSIQSLSASNEDFSKLTSKISLEGVMDSIAEGVKKFKEFVRKIFEKVKEFVKKLKDKLISFFKKKQQSSDSSSGSRNKNDIEGEAVSKGYTSLLKNTDFTGVQNGMAFLAMGKTAQVSDGHVFEEEDINKLHQRFLTMFDEAKRMHDENLDAIVHLAAKARPAKEANYVDGSYAQRLRDAVMYQGKLVFKTPFGNFELTVDDNHRFVYTKPTLDYYQSGTFYYTKIKNLNTDSADKCVSKVNSFFSNLDSKTTIKFNEALGCEVSGDEIARLAGNDASKKKNVSDTTMLEIRLADFMTTYVHILAVYMGSLAYVVVKTSL